MCSVQSKMILSNKNLNLSNSILKIFVVLVSLLLYVRGTIIAIYEINKYKVLSNVIKSFCRTIAYEG